MAKEQVKITLTFEYDQDENNGMPLRNFLYHYFNRFNNEFKILSIEYKDEIKEFDKKVIIKDLPLREVDSISDSDLPKKPDMSKVTRLPEVKLIPDLNIAEEVNINA
jgi:hypothetical protein